MNVIIRLIIVLVVHAAAQPTTAPASAPPEYHIYAGNTHSHTAFTWSHGDQWQSPKPGADNAKEPGIERTPDGAQLPGKSKTLKPDWQKLQGPPAEHDARAKAAGYDFYVTSDHSQEA